MYVRLMVAVATILLLAGCGDDAIDTGIDNTAASTTTWGGGLEGNDWGVPDPFGPVTCQRPELAAHIAGLPRIGHLFVGGEVTFQEGQLRVTGPSAGPDPQYPELIEILGEAIPGVNRLTDSGVGVSPEWRLLLNSDPESKLGSFILSQDIDAVWDFEGIVDPDTHDPEGVAAIEAEAIVTLADLEAALISIEENSAP